jgi:pyrroloquinoline quinone biosynthesis protein B
LLLLRESPAPLNIHCTPEVREELTERFPVLKMLEHYCGVIWQQIPIDGNSFQVAGVDGISFRAVPLRSNAPPYSTRRDRPAPGDNIGLMIRDTESGRQAFYAPGLGAIDSTVLAEMAAAAVLLVDGTCWHDDDMERAGVGRKLARAMGHLPQAGTGGMIETLSRFPEARRVLIHINNTNPILDENGSERQQLRGLGIEVAQDGLCLEV